MNAELVYSSAVAAIILTSHDITSRREAGQSVAELNTVLHSLMESSPLPILAIGTDGNISFWNHASETMFGWSEEEVLGNPLPFISAENRAEYEEIRRHSLAGHVIVNREIRRVRRDGVPLDLSLSTAPCRDKHGLLTGSIYVYLDIGERKRLERQLWQASKTESLGILAAGVAHDFNNLLTSILGNVSLAQQDAPRGSDQEGALLNVVEAVERAVVLTDQMLAYSGKGRFRIENVNVSDLIADMTPLLESSLGAGVDLMLNLESGLPSIQGDRGQLRQIVINVAINAGEATAGRARQDMDSERGQVLVRTGLTDPPDGRRVFIEVIDNGCGMDPATQQRMFDPFFSTKFTGRGLGLAAVLGIVRGHNGSIEVNSAPNQGTQFLISLPVAAQAAAEAL